MFLQHVTSWSESRIAFPISVQASGAKSNKSSFDLICLTSLNFSFLSASLAEGFQQTRASAGTHTTSPTTRFTSAAWTASPARAPWTSACGATGTTWVNGWWSPSTSGSSSPGNVGRFCSALDCDRSPWKELIVEFVCRYRLGLRAVAGPLDRPQCSQRRLCNGLQRVGVAPEEGLCVLEREGLQCH